jgi:hypothetical protein
LASTPLVSWRRPMPASLLPRDTRPRDHDLLALLGHRHAMSAARSHRCVQPYDVLPALSQSPRGSGLCTRPALQRNGASIHGQPVLGRTEVTTAARSAVSVCIRPTTPSRPALHV